MRSLIDKLCQWSGYAAAAFLVLIALTIVAQVIARLFGITLDSTEIGGFSLAATTFLGLAHTLQRGGHIRVTFVIQRVGPRLNRILEIWCSGVATLMMGYMDWYIVNMVIDSWEFNELSPGLLAIPVWIPQLGMAAGVTILTLAFASAFWQVITGETGQFLTAEDTALSDSPEKITG